MQLEIDKLTTQFLALQWILHVCMKTSARHAWLLICMSNKTTQALIMWLTWTWQDARDTILQPFGNTVLLISLRQFPSATAMHFSEIVTSCEGNRMNICGWKIYTNPGYLEAQFTIIKIPPAVHRWAGNSLWSQHHPCRAAGALAANFGVPKFTVCTLESHWH